MNDKSEKIMLKKILKWKYFLLIFFIAVQNLLVRGQDSYNYYKVYRVTPTTPQQLKAVQSWESTVR